MTKAKYMALADFQTLWSDKIKPTIPTQTAVKGNAESEYRTGNVNITPANIGLGNVDNTADANKNVNYANAAGYADTVDGNHAIVEISNFNSAVAPSSILFGAENYRTGAPTTDYTYGLKLRFHRDSETYFTDIAQSLYYDRLFFRRHSDDGFKDWMEIIHSGNIGSQSVNYATSAGSAPANGGNSSTVNGHTVNSDVPANAVFTDTNTWRPLGTGSTDACAGDDSRLSNSRPASDVYSWAKASTKPSYTASEVGISSSVEPITSNTSSSCSITGSSNDGKSQTIIYTNSTSSDLTVTVPTTYNTPDGAAIELTCKAGGYCEVNYLNIGGTIYARGL